MNLTFGPREEALRAEVRAFFERDYPRDIIEKTRAGVPLTREDHVRAQKALQTRNWLAVAWPKEYGGPGWDATQRYVFEQELERAGAPYLLPMAIIYVGPVIYTFGTDEQKARWLPDMLESRAMWAQGYSEPESGSDLASLRMRADHDGDHYILNGTKIWTSFAQWADWIFCLARTSNEGRRQEGISFICADMRTPGVTVRPIITIEGMHRLNQVEFKDVRVPVSQRIGEEGKGWFYATYLLKNERISYAHVARKKEDMRRLREMAASMPGDDGGTMIEDPLFLRRIAACEAAIEVLDISVLRVLTAGDEAAPAEASTLKIFATETAQQITELYVMLAGRQTVLRDPTRNEPGFAAAAMTSYLSERAQTIYGGASEVQRNIIWKMIAQ